MTSALGSNEAIASVDWSKSSIQPGDTVAIRFNFQNKLQRQVQIGAIGINGDWMPLDIDGNPRFLGPQYSSNPVTVAAMDTFTSDSYSITIPPNIKPGIHTYYIAVDGYDSTGRPFSWDSGTFSITFGDSSTIISTPSPNPTNSEPQGNQNSLTIIAAITITGIIVVIAVTLIISRRKRHHTPTSPTQPANNQPLPPAPEEEPNKPPQDFDI